MESGIKDKKKFQSEPKTGVANPILHQPEKDPETIPEENPTADTKEETFFSIHIPNPQPPEFIKIRLLPLVITLEIFQTLLVTGSVSVVILLLRYMGGNGVAGIAAKSLCYTLMLFTFVHFAQKWRMLVPAVSVTCYTFVTLHLIYITIKFLENCCE